MIWSILAILLTGAVVIYLFGMIKTGKRTAKEEPISKNETHWVRAVISGLIIAFVFGDPIVVHDFDLAPFGEASIFFSIFFIQIFLDKRSKMRGVLAFSSLLVLGIFYYVYSARSG